MQKLSELHEDARIPVHTVLRWLDAGVQLTGDPDLGLHAVGAWGPGTGDVIEFAAASAATVGDALKAVLRYVRILNEAADFNLGVRGDLAVIELHSRVALNRPAADFQMGSLMRGLRNWLGSLDGFDIAFAHAEPRDRRAYTDVFGSARISFGAPFDAATFSSSLLSSPMSSANPALHKVLLRHAALVAEALPKDDAVVPRVRKLVSELLDSGAADSETVARKLGMSRRTLTRYLESEGVTYKELLDKTRHQVALLYLEKTSLDPQQIAFLLGYSMTASFSRAFLRWQGETPTEHRRSYRAQRK